MDKKQIIKNRLTSDLQNLMYEYESDDLTKEVLMNYFSTFLLDADVDSTIVVEVLEDNSFGEIGKQEALAIKINEGW